MDAFQHELLSKYPLKSVCEQEGCDHPPSSQGSRNRSSHRLFLMDFQHSWFADRQFSDIDFEAEQKVSERRCQV